MTRATPELSTNVVATPTTPRSASGPSSVDGGGRPGVAFGLVQVGDVLHTRIVGSPHRVGSREEGDVATSTSTGLRRGLSLWQAVGISVALMAPSMAANINPQGTAGLVGRATPLAFFLAAVAVLLIAYVFVRLCQYYQHAGSVYVFAGATLGPRAGATAGLSLLGTYTFYGLVTASATGVFGAQFLDDTDIWTDQPSWAGFVVGGLALVLVLWLAIVPARRATTTLLVIEGLTVLLILVIALIAFVRMAAGSAPGDAELTLDVFKVEPGTDTSTLFLGIVFGLCRSPASRPQPPWARRPTSRAATSRARSWAPRSSAASTSRS